MAALVSWACWWWPRLAGGPLPVEAQGPAPGSARQRLAASLRLLQQELSGYGLAASPAATIEDILRFVEVDLKIPVGTELIDRFQAVLFGDSEATAADLERAEALGAT